MPAPLAPGLYEQLIDGQLRRALLDLHGARDHTTAVDPAEAPRILARHVARWLERALRDTEPDARLALCHRVFDVLRPTLDLGDEARLELRQLLAVVPGDPLVEVAPPVRPGVPLSDTGLLVNARGEHRIGDEIGRELASADRVDLLCSFLVWSGFVRLRDGLQDLLQRRGKRLRVLTTTYCGATERRVLDELVALGAEVRVSYDVRRTRLHAKAWLFQRDSGFHTGYVGSSNLSAPALTDGLEWNVRLSAIETSHVLDKFRATFEAYWQDGEFEPYDPCRDADRFDQAVHGERRGDGAATLISALEVRPYDYQREILERLDAERRVHDRWRNLVVAATGTGKTVLAALDFQREVTLAGRPLRLLFVAHRKEILAQSLATFRQVVRDGQFGGLYVGGERPQAGQSVFASVQSLAHLDLAAVPSDHWDFVIVDEFHHAAAETYTRLLNHLQPRILLGLTATPERADGKDILRWFGGRTAAELRLWDAIDRSLLSPFQYFGLADGVDISAYWRNGKLDLDALDGVFSAHHLRVRTVLRELQRHVVRPRTMRALGFCVGKAHARFMAAEFTKAGLAALALTAETPAVERARATQLLASGDVCALFTVDLFNEGIDLPSIDTVLMLRPTESSTVFLQQLGRGLRLAPGKSCLTVLDFVGTAHREFRFDVRYRALVGGTRADLVRHIETGFPVLPAGCAIQLAPDAAKLVLANLRQALSHRTDRLLAELRALGPSATLQALLDHTGLDLEDVYRHGRSYTSLRRMAGLPCLPPGPDDDGLAKAMGRLAHNDDPRLLMAVLKHVHGATPPNLGQFDAACFATALVTLLGEQVVLDLPAALARLWQHPAIRDELRQLFALLLDRVVHRPLPLERLSAVPLQVHCRYRREQVMAALRVIKNGRLYAPREGVLYLREIRADLFFVTLHKSEKDYSPTTMYKDCALAADLFQWESQSTTSLRSNTGQRHVRHRELGVTPLLFVRERDKGEGGETVPFLLLGSCELEAHEGERPIRIDWRLHKPMPADFFRQARLAA